ncbi:uncharacterized protein At2g29880-like [Salvia hispanica]|uniref:uncharacterized protein At2g29880-like n=1 Tax=Salvia hispanica TaxID=49212 RepID=UPI002009B6C2|nr:uncharacterized protein At2g29880-like [Salvia hispanica]
MSHFRRTMPNGSLSQGNPSAVQYRRPRLRRVDRSRRSWSDREELALIAAMKELVATGWKADNGFRGGYLNKVEEYLLHDFPTTDLRAQPHIQSKITAWKKSYNALCIILKRSGVGFNVHNDFKIDCSDEQWDHIINGDSSFKGMRTKAWPLLEDWRLIFGKDRACGEPAENMEEARRSRRVSETDDASRGYNSDYNATFDENSPEMPIGYNEATDHGEDSTTQSASIPTSNPKRAARKRKNSDDSDGLLQLLEKLHTETNSRLDNLSNRIGYEIDIGKSRQAVFEQLSGISGLSDRDRYDLCDIIGKENTRLEIFMGIPPEKKAGYVYRVLEKENAM